MDNASWIGLLRLIPPAQQENLLLMTTRGIGLAVQGLTRLEKDYVVIRGRLMGSTDEGGGFFFVPYDNILYLSFQKMVKQQEILTMYGNAEPGSGVTVPAAPAGESGRTGAAPAPGPAATPAAPAAAAPAGTPGSGVRPLMPAGKAALLERLRAR